MDRNSPPVLVVNSASGSFSEEAVSAVREALGGGNGAAVRTVDCRSDDVPGRPELEAAETRVFAIFAGDGTISRNLVKLEAEGWGGAVLPLPGGTQNLLSTAMFGKLSATEIAAMCARGELAKTRRHCLRCESHTALAEILCGPGARWADVREDMRAGEMGELVSEALDITRESASGALVRLIEPARGREEGYPGLHFSLPDGAMVARGYRMENLGDWIRQGWAMATRDFREGPFDELGTMERARCAALPGAEASETAEPLHIDLMIDGERETAGAEALVAREPFGLTFLGLRRNEIAA
jgi:hypothetical protein